jgi:hypothetical protein
MDEAYDDTLIIDLDRKRILRSRHVDGGENSVVPRKTMRLIRRIPRLFKNWKISFSTIVKVLRLCSKPRLR